MRDMRAGSGEVSPTHHHVKLLAMAWVIALVIALWVPAAFADCPLTDPTCAGGTIDQAKQTITDTGNGAGDPVNGVVDSAQDTVTKTTKTVTDTVDGILHPGDGSGGGPGGGGGNGGGSGSRQGSPTTVAGTPNVLRRTDIPVIPTAPASSRTGPLQQPAGHRPGFLGRVGGAVAGVAKRVAFPIALALAVILFLLIQDRLDRRDPKLSLAPVAPDVLRFD